MIQFKMLHEVEPDDIIELMNHPLVRRQMPLATGPFGPDECRQFIAAKQRLWDEHGYGPWAFCVEEHFVGWGGLQPENGEADLALVLHPQYWGTGKLIYHQILQRAFGEMGFASVTILLPPSRTRVRGLSRLGFWQDGEIDIEGERFIRYRLNAPGKVL